LRRPYLRSTQGDAVLAEDLFDRERTTDRGGVGLPRGDGVGVDADLACELVAAPAESQPVVAKFRTTDQGSVHAKILSTIYASGKLNENKTRR
jgi:hypothetical protein